jgi:Domain of unknown function (DUF6265)
MAWHPVVRTLGPGFALLALLLASGASRADTGSIQQLEWMAGHWRGDGAVQQEEWWTEPDGGIMLGAHRDIRSGGRTAFEFFRIAETTDGLVYFASPSGRPATPFTAIDVAARRVVFENASHDFPQRIIYEGSASGDTLTARIEGSENGRSHSMSWTWTRAERAGTH